MPEARDKNGHLVVVGSKVRLTELSPKFLESLPEDEKEEVRSMIGKVFEVYEIDAHGYAWVEKGWHFPEEGRYTASVAWMKRSGIREHERCEGQNCIPTFT